jgi:hypothetical protein
MGYSNDLDGFIKKMKDVEMSASENDERGLLMMASYARKQAEEFKESSDKVMPPSHGIRYSMDGARRNLTNSLNELSEIVNNRYFDEDDFDDIKNAFNNAACTVNGMNCVYDPDDENFNDMSDIEVRLINDE